MNDIEKAKQAVNQRGESLAVFSGGHSLYASKEAGVKPIYLAYTQGYDFTGASGTDKVVGLGAAAFWAALHIACLHAAIISEPALDFLIENEIDVTYDTLVDKIKNRAGDGFCPVETLALSCETFEGICNWSQRIS